LQPNLKQHFPTYTSTETAESYQTIDPVPADGGNDDQSLVAAKLTGAASTQAQPTGPTSAQAQLRHERGIVTSLCSPYVLSCLGSRVAAGGSELVLGGSLADEAKRNADSFEEGAVSDPRLLPPIQPQLRPPLTWILLQGFSRGIARRNHPPGKKIELGDSNSIHFFFFPLNFLSNTKGTH
jgi:hypothetical protein